MKEEQKIYIRGSKKRPNEIKKILERYGGIVHKGIIFTKEQCLYFINHNGIIVYTYLNTELANMITEYYKEVKLPDPSEHWETGDILVSDDNPNEFYVFDKFYENRILIRLKVTKDPLRINEIYQLVPYFPCHKANDEELKTFYNTLAERGLSWNAYNKNLLRGNYMYYYPKNGHYYFSKDTLRCKDRTTGEWYDAVLYSDANGQYVREIKDFNAKFKLCQ